MSKESKEAEYAAKLNIPKSRLTFFFGTIKKKETFSDNHSIIAMPFDFEEIDDLEGDKKWDRLLQIGVNYLKETGELPTFAQEQDYERTGPCSYVPYHIFKTAAELISSKKEEEKPKEIKVFNNAFDKIILPEGYREKIIETVAQLKDSKKLFEEWGLGDKIKRGKGINLLFSGQPGTGKTYCGEIIAEYLGTTFDIVSAADIEDMYVGNSEKNVKRIFDSLKGNNKVLIIDEADSFLISRGERKQNHENTLTNQMLIELERHDGICIMTTNRPVKLDKALQRRIDLCLDFPNPDEAAREKIWEYIIPDKMPKEDIGYKKISEYSLNGGGIKNALMSAARKMIVDNIKKLDTNLLIKSITEELAEIDAISNGGDHS